MHWLVWYDDVYCNAHISTESSSYLELAELHVHKFLVENSGSVELRSGVSDKRSL